MWIRQLVTVDFVADTFDFVADTVDFVANVYIRGQSHTVDFQQSVEFNFVANVYRALELENETWEW